jgi:hypothetical protein
MDGNNLSGGSTLSLTLTEFTLLTLKAANVYWTVKLKLLALLVTLWDVVS